MDYPELWFNVILDGERVNGVSGVGAEARWIYDRFELDVDGQSFQPNPYIILVCQVCMLHHANGEWGDCYAEEGHDREPFNLYHPKDITMGLLDELHDCILDRDGSAIECGCEERGFSWSSCQGCGSTLGGSRYAFTAWES